MCGKLNLRSTGSPSVSSYSIVYQSDVRKIDEDDIYRQLEIFLSSSFLFAFLWRLSGSSGNSTASCWENFSFQVIFMFCANGSNGRTVGIWVFCEIICGLLFNYYWWVQDDRVCTFGSWSVTSVFFWFRWKIKYTMRIMSWCKAVGARSNAGKFPKM